MIQVIRPVFSPLYRIQKFKKDRLGCPQRIIRYGEGLLKTGAACRIPPTVIMPVTKGGAQTFAPGGAAVGQRAWTGAEPLVVGTL